MALTKTSCSLLLLLDIEGPMGMAKGALLWGGMVYVLNGSIRATTSPITRYQEEPVEF